MKTFGEIAWNWPKVNSKKKLIQSRVASKSGAASKIFRETGVQVNLSNHLLGFLAKELSIKGYRIDEKPFREKMLPKLSLAIENGNENEKVDKAYWTIYDRSCQLYLLNKQSNLNKCLENEIPLISPKTTKDFFQQLAVHLSKYNISRENLLEFSQFWHFEEIENFDEEVFSNEQASLIAMNQLVMRLTENEINPLKSSVEDLRKDHATIAEKIENIPNLKQINFLIEQAASHSKEIKTYVDKKLTSIPSDFERRLVGFAESIEELKKTVAKVHSNKDFQSSVTELRSKIEALEKKIENVVVQETRSPVIPVAVLDAPAMTAVSKINEIDFIKLMSSQLKKDTNFGWVDDLLLTLFHCIFSSTGPIILKDSGLFEMWVKFQPGLKCATIFPEADWVNSDEFEMCLSEHKDRNFIMVENFEIGIYEAYALPSLLKIMAESKIKLVFKSGEYTEILPSHQLLKFVPILSLQQNDRFRERRPIIKSNVLIDNPTSSGTDWDSKRNLKEVLDFIPTVTTYSKSAGVEIPPTLLRVASDLANHLNFYFDDKSAIAVAIEVVILPYLLEKFGRELCGSFVTAANTFLDDQLGIA